MGYEPGRFPDEIGHTQYENGKRKRGRPRGSRKGSKGVIEPWSCRLFCVITNIHAERHLRNRKVRFLEIIGRRIRVHLTDGTIVEL